MTFAVAEMSTSRSLVESVQYLYENSGVWPKYLHMNTAQKHQIASPEGLAMTEHVIAVWQAEHKADQPYQ